MIDTESFYQELLKNQLDYFVGVPDSLLKHFCACVAHFAKGNHLIAANEGNAIAIASGYHMATGHYGVVYMQNSGLGNAINPLISLADEAVYQIPMLLLIGYRGEPGTLDEPQHRKQGELTLPLLDTLGIPFQLLKEDYPQQIAWCRDYLRQEKKPVALVVRQGSFLDVPFSPKKKDGALSREQALSCILGQMEQEDLIVSTTGKTSRELFELREKNHMGHSHDFLTVGSMGHAASIALGVSLQTKQRVYCIDGDGALLMHMGGVAVAAQKAKDNYKYLLMNNGCHESVGRQPTIADQLDLEKILLGFGFPTVYRVRTRAELEKAMSETKTKGKMAIVIEINATSRRDLGRPTVTPLENKMKFQESIRKWNHESTYF